MDSFNKQFLIYVADCYTISLTTTVYNSTFSRKEKIWFPEVVISELKMVKGF